MVDEPKLKTDHFEYSGTWFLPETPQNVVDGTVSYSNGSIKITINGDLTGQGNDQVIPSQQLTNERPDTLLGITNEGIEITLENLFLISRQTGINLGNRFHISEYTVRKMLIGGHYNNDSELLFTMVSIQYSNFKEWINESGITTDQTFDPYSVSINYIPPYTHEGRANDNFEYQIFPFEKTPGFVRDTFDSSIAQDFNFILKSEKLFHYNEFYKIHERIRKFFMLCIDSTIHPLLITGYTGDILRSPILIYNSFVNVSGTYPHLRNDQMFIPFNFLSGRFPTAIQRWLNAYELLDDSIDLYFENVINNKLYPQDLFENLIQSLEAYHRGSLPDELLEEQQFEQLINGILNVVTDPQQREWINGHRGLGNTLSLAQKLFQLFELFPYLYNNKDTQWGIIRQIRDQRVFFTHHVRSHQRNTVEDVDVFFLNLRLTVLIVACLFSELGFEENWLQRVVIRYAQRLRKVGLVGVDDPFDWFA